MSYVKKNRIPTLKRWSIPYERIVRHVGGVKQEPSGLRSKK